MAPHSSTLAWKIPRMEEPGGLQSMGSLRVRHGWATSLSLIGEGNGNPLQCSCLENPRDGGAWWAAVYRVAQSRTRLKWLSSSSSSSSSPLQSIQRIHVHHHREAQQGGHFPHCAMQKQAQRGKGACLRSHSTRQGLEPWLSEGDLNAL